MNVSAVAISDLARRFGRHRVIERLNIDVPAGARVGLHGPNGSGKSTVLRCIAGTVRPTSGHVVVCGHPAGSSEARQMVGATLAQERSFYLRLTGRANLRFFARLRLSSARAAARAVAELEEELEIKEIAAERADRCSSGMIQQLAFARALLGEPPVLLLDEPTRSLDGPASARLWSALERRPDTAVLIASHHQSDMARCDRLIELPT